MRTAIIISTFLQVSLLHHFSSTHRPSSAASWGTLKSIFLYQFVNGKLEIINLVFHAPIYLFILFLWGYFFPNKQGDFSQTAFHSSIIQHRPQVIYNFWRISKINALQHHTNNLQLNYNSAFTHWVKWACSSKSAREDLH